MTGDPEEPAGRGTEYPPLERFRGSSDPYAPVDYPPSYPPPPPSAYPPPAAGYPQTYPGHPPYPGYPVDPYDPYQYDPYQTVKPPGTNAKAIGSLVTSLVGLLCCGLASIAGVVFGIIAMRETKRTGQDGWGIALAGTIIGGVVVAFWLLLLLFWIFWLLGAGASSPTYS
jgi:Domain of unknown function (DUF4190)